jgi:hypothetical protein
MEAARMQSDMLRNTKLLPVSSGDSRDASARLKTDDR